MWDRFRGWSLGFATCLRSRTSDGASYLAVNPSERIVGATAVGSSASPPKTDIRSSSLAPLRSDMAAGA